MNNEIKINQKLVSSNSDKPSTIENVFDKAMTVVDKIDKLTVNLDVTKRYPNIELLIKIIAVVCICLLFYAVYRIFLKGPIYSGAQLAEAMKLNTEGFSIDEIARVNLEINSLKTYHEYFSSAPYSLESQGIHELARGVIFLPVVAFISIYIIPPIVISYILWFVIKYWKAVFEALWGWFLMLYHFGTKLIECKLGEKWYIRMVTGWHSCTPSFSTYFNSWKTQYIDVPVYYEKLNYIKQYYDNKLAYFTPYKQKYFDKPLALIKEYYGYLKQYTIEIWTFIKNLFIKARDYVYKLVLEFDQESSTIKRNIIIYIFALISGIIGLAVLQWRRARPLH